MFVYTLVMFIIKECCACNILQLKYIFSICNLEEIQLNNIVSSNEKSTLVRLCATKNLGLNK